MRVALCISGAPRFVGNSFEMLLRSIGGYYACDIFFYVWKGPFSTAEELTSYAEPFLRPGCRIAEARVVDEYQPVIQGEYLVQAGGNIGNIFKMHYAIEQCNNLKRAQEYRMQGRYDAVIRSRTDMYINRSLDLREFARVLERFVVLPISANWGGGYNDQFALASSVNMDIYADAFNRLSAYGDRGFPIHPVILSLLWSGRTECRLATC